MLVPQIRWLSGVMTSQGPLNTSPVPSGPPKGSSQCVSPICPHMTCRTWRQSWVLPLEPKCPHHAWHVASPRKMSNDWMAELISKCRIKPMCRTIISGAKQIPINTISGILLSLFWAHKIISVWYTESSECEAGCNQMSKHRNLRRKINCPWL